MRMPTVRHRLRVARTHHDAPARLRARVSSALLLAAVFSSYGAAPSGATTPTTLAARAASKPPASSPAADTDAPVYCFDPVHTRVMLAIDHAGFSKALGTVSGTRGEVRFDPEQASQAQVRATVPLQRLDFGDAKWNKAVLAANLLDAARYPDAVFVSDRVEVADRQPVKVHGTLTMHGVSQPVVLDIAVNAIKRHPLPPFRRTVGVSARTTLSRKAFGIDAWPSVIGDAVELRIEAEATRGGCDEKATPSSDQDGATGRATDPALPASDAATSDKDADESTKPQHAPETPQ